ncbi:hypothetical protein KV557_17455, partial [Kitasatospora aureofaciens]|nr:hypothetical protein [Kitasatospora aureofaciens]
ASALTCVVARPEGDPVMRPFVARRFAKTVPLAAVVAVGVGVAVGAADGVASAAAGATTAVGAGEAAATVLPAPADVTDMSPAPATPTATTAASGTVLAKRRATNGRMTGSPSGRATTQVRAEADAAAGELFARPSSR